VQLCHAWPDATRALCYWFSEPLLISLRIINNVLNQLFDLYFAHHIAVLISTSLTTCLSVWVCHVPLHLLRDNIILIITFNTTTTNNNIFILSHQTTVGKNRHIHTHTSTMLLLRRFQCLWRHLFTWWPADDDVTAVHVQLVE